MGENTLRSSPSQLGQIRSGSSLKDWTTSRCCPQLLQAYSYVGIPHLDTGPGRTGGLALVDFECQVYRA